MQKYKLIIEYEGTAYSGWQSQENARSVQDTLIAAVSKVFNGNIDVQGAGRTDAGVHALGQVAHLSAPTKIPLNKLLFAINDELPSTINIISCEYASPNFHARHDAKSRSYLYIISSRRSAFGKRYSWWIKDKLDVEKMRIVAELFVGFNDFASFADKRIDKNKSTMVNVARLEVHSSNDLIAIRIVASHFLWKMVRRIVGIIVASGKGAITRDDVENMFANHSPLPAEHTAPPSGLYLEHISYSNEKEIILPSLPMVLSLSFPSLQDNCKK
ncbi:MAG: tRNA pseudouridine(38-40) synthase TruA [Deltaproteobacteria bacterium]